MLSALGIVFLFTNTANAQLAPEFGAKGGVNFATLNNTDGLEAKPGILIGGYMKLNIPGSPIAIQPEILYAQYGANAENSSGQLKLDYVQIPILLNFEFGFPAASFTLGVFFGPYVGYNVLAEADNGNGLAGNQDEFYRDIDFGVVVGTGININEFSISVRYTAGLTTVFEDQFEDGEKNGAIGVTFGVAF